MNPNFGNIGKSDLHPNLHPNLNRNKNEGGNQVGPNNEIFTNDPHHVENDKKPGNLPHGARFDPFGPPNNAKKIDPNPDELKPPSFEGVPKHVNSKKTDPFL
jgi:hypothetical protein